jgi:predicted transcriptional regulator
MKRVKTTITLDDQILEELNEYSLELNTKKSHIIEASLTAFFDYLDLRLAEKRLEEEEIDGSSIEPAGAVWRELDLD